MTWINDPEVTFYFARLGRKISRSEETRIVRGLIDSKTDRIFSIFEGESYVGRLDCRRFIGLRKMDESALCFGEMRGAVELADKRASSVEARVWRAWPPQGMVDCSLR